MIESYFREVVRSLYKADGWFDLFCLHKEKRLSPAQIAECIDLLTSKGHAELGENPLQLRLTPDGYRWVDENAVDLFLRFRADQEWRATPVAEGPKEPYIPTSSELELDFLTKLASST